MLFSPGPSPTDRRRRPRELFDQADWRFRQLLTVPNLDEVVRREPAAVTEVEKALNNALTNAFTTSPSARARLFLQRVLYRIYRLKLFWYDPLGNYENERSDYLRGLRDRIEHPWQAWQDRQGQSYGAHMDVAQALQTRVSIDLDPPLSEDQLYFRDDIGLAGYRKLLQIASLDGLVEASQLSRVLGGAGNEIHSMLTRLIVEEYGGGQLRRKHSSYFKAMLEELRMDTKPEAYFDDAPWEVLAGINFSFLLSERKRFFLRYIGGLLYFETAVPAAFKPYQSAAERLGLTAAAGGYWALHILEDERHGKWMINDVAMPLLRMYPRDAWEIVWGYDQQRAISARAGTAVARACRAADATAASS